MWGSLTGHEWGKLRWPPGYIAPLRDEHHLLVGPATQIADEMQILTGKILMYAQYFHVFQHLAAGVEEVACAWGLMTASLPTAEALWVKAEREGVRATCSRADFSSGRIRS